MSTSPPRVLVYGASGFVGSAVVLELRAAGAEVTVHRAPRLPATTPESALSAIEDPRWLAPLLDQMAGADAVVNCAGNPDASLTDPAQLTSPNGILPGLLAAAAARQPSPPRFVHVSSAVVQGSAPQLDDSPAVSGFSAYSRSKVLGEQLALSHGPSGRTVVYRPPSVHAADRRVTRRIGAIARSPLAAVAGSGDAPSPQALLPNVASAVAFLALTPATPPPIVTHPSEGLTTASVMELLGGRQPRHMPRALARLLVGGLAVGGRVLPSLAPNARRVEMLLFGQAQAPSWLMGAGWEPPLGLEGWRRLRHEMDNQRDHEKGRAR